MTDTTPPPGRWPVGDTEIEGMVERGELEYVTASSSHADLLMDQADGHLSAAAPLVEVHPPSAYALLYDAARKAMTAVLAKQGLRPTNRGGHRAVQDAAEAQLGDNTQHLIRPFRALRKRRHHSEYPSLGDAPVTSDEARDAHADAGRILTAMKKLLPHVGPFRK